MIDSDKQRKLNELLLELATNIVKGDDNLNRVCEILKNVYTGDFRHSYSQIFAVIEKQISKNENCSFEYLTANLDYVSDYIHKNSPEKYDLSIVEKFEKFYDHVMLESARMGYFNNTSSKYKDIESKLDNLDSIFDEKINAQNKKILDNTETYISEAKQKVDSLRAESVTVLSIFASVVLAFMGGLNLLGSVLTSINSASIFRLVMISSIIGFVLFNTIFMLIYMVARIINRQIYTFCSSSQGGDCISKISKCPKDCWAIIRLKNRLPYVFWVNAILLTLMLVDVIAWCIIRK